MNVYGVSQDRITVIVPGATNWEEIPTTVSFADIKKKYSLPETYILYVGTLESRKNIGGIIDAYRQSAYLKKYMPIVFAGSLGKNGKTYVHLIDALSNAQYIGYVLEEEKKALYAHARLFVYPSFYEGFGLPLLEAISAGVPCIGTHRSALPEAMGDAGILINPYNGDTLSRAMESLVEDGALYTDLKHATQQQRTHFSWKQSAEQLFRLIISHS